jgi:hypothetical protein
MMISENNQEVFVFRPLKHYWLKRGTILLLILILVEILFYMIELPIFGLVFCGGVVAILVFLVTLLPLLLTRFELDKDVFKARTPDDKFDIRWEDVVVARPISERKYNALHLATNDNTFYIPLQYVDSHKVWEMTKVKIPPI